jgi:fructokinase
MGRFDLRLICITRGAKGSLLCDRRDVHEHAGYRVKVKNTVGAGDAFTAALIHEYLRQRTLAEMNDTANRMGAWVASHSDAMPESPARGLDTVLADLC